MDHSLKLGLFHQELSDSKRGHWRTQDLKKGGVVVEGITERGRVREGDVPPPARSAEAFENVNSVC